MTPLGSRRNYRLIFRTVDGSAEAKNAMTARLTEAIPLMAVRYVDERNDANDVYTRCLAPARAKNYVNVVMIVLTVMMSTLTGPVLKVVSNVNRMVAVVPAIVSYVDRVAPMTPNELVSRPRLFVISFVLETPLTKLNVVAVAPLILEVAVETVPSLLEIAPSLVEMTL